MKIVSVNVSEFVMTGMLFAILVSQLGIWMAVLAFVTLVVIGNVLKIVDDIIGKTTEDK